MPARELGPPYGRLTRETNRFSGLWRVFHVPHTRDTTGFGCPLYAEASGALTTDLHSPVAACRFSAARPCTPVPHPSPGGDRDDASTRVHLCSPIRRFPSPAIPGWHRNRLGFSPGLRTPPPRRRRRTPGWGQALSTCPGLHLRHQPNLQPVNPLALSSFVSHMQSILTNCLPSTSLTRGLLRRDLRSTPSMPRGAEAPLLHRIRQRCVERSANCAPRPRQPRLSSAIRNRVLRVMKK